MDPVNFCYWLRGFIEIQRPKGVDERQLDIIDEHLNLVFGTTKKEGPTSLKDILHMSKGEISVQYPIDWPPGSC